MLGFNLYVFEEMFCTVIDLSPRCLSASRLVPGLINTLGIAVILPSCLSSPWKKSGNIEQAYIYLYMQCHAGVIYVSSP